MKSPESGRLQLHRLMTEVFWIALFAATLPLNAADDFAGTVPEKSVLKFKQLDHDGNGRLSVDEYVARREPADLYRRDFLMFDFDQDNFLSLGEFAPIANGVHGKVRGRLPDPFVKMVDQMAADLDRNLKNWDERPNEEIPIADLSASLPAEYATVLTPNLLEQADSDHNGEISRREARRFLEVQLGVRLPSGRPLRMANGNVNNYVWFLDSDRNRDEQIEWPEFMTQTGSAAQSSIKRLFMESDHNGDRILSLDEWFISWWTFDDPFENFRLLDANCDGFVDAVELFKGSPPWKKTGVNQLVKAFDEDQDGRMSITEYRISPHGNTVLGWYNLLSDLDQDQKLSLDEYRFERPLFPMLREFYFRKFDLNHDGFLDRTEFEFKTERPFEMYVMNADGTGLKRIDVGKNVRFGSPAVSPDGNWVAFDGSTEFNTSLGLWQVQVIPISGGNPRQICNGVMPTWSKDGLKLTCSRFQPQHGIWIVDVAGNRSESISQGWGSQWSPDGKKIYSAQGNSMRVYDTATKLAQIIVKPGETEYLRFDINCTWSPDSQRICINARKTPNVEMSDIVIVDLAANGNEKTKVRYTGRLIGSDFAWHPEGRRVICSMYCEGRTRQQFYEFDPDAEKGPLTLVPGQIENKRAQDATWTPDGKQLIFTVAADE